MGNGKRRRPAHFALPATESGDAAQIAERAARLWRDIEAALSPIVGVGGVDALYRRSIHLLRADYPWLEAARTDRLVPGDLFASLQHALSQSSDDDSAAASGRLLDTFHDLLTTLIGSSLTERLLGSIWERPLSGHDPKDDIR